MNFSFPEISPFSSLYIAVGMPLKGEGCAFNLSPESEFQNTLRQIAPKAEQVFASAFNLKAIWNVTLAIASVPFLTEGITPAIQNAAFAIKNAALAIKNGTFAIPNAAFRIGNAAPSIQNVTPAIKNGTFAIQNATFGIGNAALATASVTPQTAISTQKHSLTTKTEQNG